jgi:hypothetical protein
MKDTHIKTAHQYGVNVALKECGYSSPDEVVKEAAELGLVDQTKTAEPENDIFAALRQKLS